MKSGIYRIINTINSQYYIGSAVNLSARRSQHFSDLKKDKHRNRHLQSSFKKYGEPNFIFDIIEFCEIEKLIEREQFWINNYKLRGEILYNINPIAGSQLGRKFTEEQKNNLSKAKKGQPAWNKGISPSKETREKISKKLKGKTLVEETKKKMSASRKGRRGGMTGKKLSQAHIDALRNANIGRKMTEGNKAKIREFNKNRIFSEDTKLKMSLAKKGKPSNRLGVTLSEETKEKMRNKIPWNKDLRLVKVAS